MWLSAGRGLHSTEPEFTPDTVGFLTFRFCSQWRYRLLLPPNKWGRAILKGIPWDVWVALAIAAVAVVLAAVFDQSPLLVFMLVALARSIGQRAPGSLNLLQQAIRTSHQQRG